jgi:hypothetical protein
MRSGIPIFRQKRLDEKMRERSESIKNQLDEEDRRHLLSVDKDNYITYIIEENWFNPVSIGIDEYGIKPASGSNDDAHVLFPVSGNTELLKYRPSSYTQRTIHGVIRDDHLEIPIKTRTRGYTNEDIEQKVEDIVSFVDENYEKLSEDLKSGKQELRSTLERRFDNHRKDAKQHKEAFQQLDVPLIKNPSKETFELDEPNRISKIEKPNPELNQPIPVINHDSYIEILQTINNVGEGFERATRLFRGLDEEDFRDHILFH